MSWVEALTRRGIHEEAFGSTAGPVDGEFVDDSTYRSLIALEDTGVPDALVLQRLERFEVDLDNPEANRHDIARDHLMALIGMHSRGRSGVPRGLEVACSTFVLAVADTRSTATAIGEFRRMIQGAALKIAKTGHEVSQALGLQAPAGGGELDTGSLQEPPSWDRVDLTSVLDEDHQPLMPSLFERSDGVCLLYPGMIHSIHGESESGKSLVMQAVCVRLILAGQDVLYLDFESDKASVTQRLTELGATKEAILNHFDYRHPEVKPSAGAERSAWDALLQRPYALVIIDGVTDAFGVYGCSTTDNDDVARWIREVPKVIAARTGAAVVLIDHVTKDASTRNRFAIGGQAKMASLTGTACIVEVVRPLGKGLTGEVVLRVAKDRPGAIRSHCGSFRKGDRTQEAARIEFDSTVVPVKWTVHPPDAGDGDSSSFRPTALMERISKTVEQNPRELTKTKAALQVGGKKQATLAAIDILLKEEFLSAMPDGRAPVLQSLKPYRQADDEASDCYQEKGTTDDA